MKTEFCIATLGGILITVASLAAERLPQEVRTRSAAVEEIRNEDSAFVVRVDVDHKDRVYVNGDALQATVKSQRQGFLYLLYLNAKGETICLFPNKYQANNQIRANETVQVPGPGANYRIRIEPPLGREVLKAVVSSRPLSAKDLSVETLSAGVAKEVSERGVRSARVELNNDYQSRDWAEHQVELTTVERRGEAKKSSRYGAVVTVAKYKDSQIRPLPACSKDADLMKNLFRDYGRMDDIVTLQDEQATRANVEQLFKVLAQGTKPGDEIFIYWSGHGATVADTHGDSASGLDGVLVTHDASRDGVARTGVLDNVLGRWFQDLDGRRVVLILDVCMAGIIAGKDLSEKSPIGEGVAEKSLFSELKGQDRGADTNQKIGLFHFFENKFAEIKAIDQKETALLCSSSGKEISLIRRDGASSVMTGFLADFVNGAKQSVSLNAAYDHVKVEVPKYVREKFPGMDQQPQFSDNMSTPAYVRP